MYLIGVFSFNHVNIISGFYAPLIMDGKILVDGVLVSTYGSFDHDLAHIAVSPMQWFPQIVDWIFGEDNGDSVYIKIDESFGEWILPFGHLFKKNRP